MPSVVTREEGEFVPHVAKVALCEDTASMGISSACSAHNSQVIQAASHPHAVEIAHAHNNIDANCNVSLTVRSNAETPLGDLDPPRRRLRKKTFCSTVVGVSELFAQSQAPTQRCFDPARMIDEGSSSVRNLIDGFFLHDVPKGGLAATLWKTIIDSACPTLQGFGIAKQLDLLVLLALRNRQTHQELNDFVEFFAGNANLSYELIRVGLKGVRLDKSYGGEMHDIQTPVGFKTYLHELLMVRKGGCVWLGTQCSSFLVICKWQSQRSCANNFLGDSSKQFVEVGNDLMARSSLLYFLAYLVSAEAVLEQPLNSMMPRTPPLSTVFSFLQSLSVQCRTVTWLGSFGGPTPKSIQLWHLGLLSSGLVKRSRPKGLSVLTTSSVSKNRGRKQFNGIPSALKASQEYPRAFALVVAKLTLQNLQRCSLK